MSTTTSPTELQYAILDTLRTYFSGRVKHVGGYWPLDEVTEEPVSTVETPALVLRLESQQREDGADPANRLVMRVSFALYCVLSLRTTNLYFELAELATDVVRVLAQTVSVSKRGQDWGLGYAVEPPEAITDDEAEFVPGPTGTESRVVRWEQVVAYANTLTEPAAR